jgi:dienelactone hydrolase
MKPSNNALLLVLAVGLVLWSGLVLSEPYDPLQTSSEGSVQTLDLTVADVTRKREVPLRIYLPLQTSPAPVVLFSHGLGGSREGSVYLGRHWAARGYLAVFLQHPGSDTSVWQGVPPADRMATLRDAANARTFMQRVQDVPTVLDQLAQWGKDQSHPLAGRVNIDKVGMSGHSFGAVTTQAVSGQRDPRGRTLFTDKRIDAAIVMSPSAPRRSTAESAFGAISLPWMLLTGTRDTAPIGNADLASRLAVYPALPAGGKYELVLNDAEHSAFTDRALPGDAMTRNPNHHKAILALTTAFWDAWVAGDAAAQAWLDGPGPAGVLDKADRWSRK